MVVRRQLELCRNAALAAVANINDSFEAHVKDLADAEAIVAYEETGKRREIVDKPFDKLFLCIDDYEDAYTNLMHEIRVRRHAYLQEVNELIEQGERATAPGALYDISAFCNACSELSSVIGLISTDFTQR